MLKSLEDVFDGVQAECLTVPRLGILLSKYFTDLFAAEIQKTGVGGYRSVEFGKDVACFESANGKVSFVPVSGFAIAYRLCNYYGILKEYRELALSIFTPDEIKGMKDRTLSREEIARIEIKLNDSADRDKLSKFLSEYNSWGGGKTINRGDFFVSPLMKCASLQAESQSAIAELAQLLWENKELYNAFGCSMGDVNMDANQPLQQIADASFFIKQLLAAIRTKPFVLMAGISGTGKSRIVRQLARATVTVDLQEQADKREYDKAEFDEKTRWLLHKPANFEIVQVKPNWHNSMDVVGYKTNIPQPHYEFTPFVRFVAKAWENPDVPFFLCLDEMNLAPVEQYFAEYLSAIESREKENGKYVTDAIIQPFEKFGDVLCAEMLDELFPKYKAGADSEYKERMTSVIETIRTKGLTLPENLIVIGTVNMDETAFSFSRKVLDRAMSFVMNEVNLGGFLTGVTGSEVPLLVEQNTLFVDRPITALDVKDQVERDVIIDYLSEINKVLNKTPFKLGYRAANEAFLYAAAAKHFGQDDVYAALDDFTMMKILSRIEGDKSQLRVYGEDGGSKDLLEELKKVIEAKLGKTFEGESEKRELKSLEKLGLMSAQLAYNGFVSYW